MELENIILNEVSQAQKTTFFYSTGIYCIPGISSKWRKNIEKVNEIPVLLRLTATVIGRHIQMLFNLQ
jgi:hypothetical protein